MKEDLEEKNSLDENSYEAPDEPGNTDYPVDDVNDEPKKKSNTPIIILAVVCIAAIIGIVIYLVVSGMKKDKKAADKIVKLGDYKEFTYAAYDGTITDEEIVSYYEEMVATYTAMGYTANEKIEGSEGSVVEDGDTVNLDFAGYQDGVAFAGGTGNSDLTIGSGGFIPGFEEQLIGHTIGETFDINVSFPDPYPNNPDLAGKPAVFTCTMNYKCESVELTVDNAYSSLFGFDSLEELYADLRSYLEQNSANDEVKHIETCKSDYVDHIIEGSEFKDITAEVDAYYENYVKGIEVMLGENGTDFETAAKSYGYDDGNAFKEELKSQSEKEIKKKIALAKIAEDEKIKFTDKDYETLGLELITGSGYSTVAEYAEKYDGYYGEGSYREYVEDIFYINKLFDKYAKEGPATSTEAN